MFFFFLMFKPSKEWLVQTANESIIWLLYQGKSLLDASQQKADHLFLGD